MVIFSEMGGHWPLLCAIIQQLFLADWHHNYWHSNSQPDLWAKFLLPPSLQKRVCPLPNQDRSEVWFCDRHELSIVSAGCSTQWAGCEMKTLGYCSGWFLASLLCCRASSFQVFCLCLKFRSEIATRICVDPWSPWSKQKKVGKSAIKPASKVITSHTHCVNALDIVYIHFEELQPSSGTESSGFSCCRVVAKRESSSHQPKCRNEKWWKSVRKLTCLTV